MKDYIVKVFDRHPMTHNEWFLVKSDNKKEAINKTHARLGGEYFKKDLKAFTLQEFYDNEDIAVIH